MVLGLVQFLPLQSVLLFQAVQGQRQRIEPSREAERPFQSESVNGTTWEKLALPAQTWSPVGLVVSCAIDPFKIGERKELSLF